jgi:pimeloyl-ACP methyl ester carboxylesterase
MMQATRTEQGIRYLETASPDCSSVVTYLLLHGLGGSLEQWGEVIPKLGEDARTIAIDIPGFGQSRMLTGKFNLDIAVDQIIEFCKSRNVTECILVSHSGGSFVAARLATVAPGLFTRLVMVDGTLVRAFDIARNPRHALSNPRLGFIVAWNFIAGILPVPRVVLQTIASSVTLKKLALWGFVARPSEVPPDRLVELLANSGSLSVLHVLLHAKSIDHVALISEVTQPIDLIWGGKDRLINNDDILFVRRIAHIVGERVISGCGHWPWLEAPAELASFISAPTAYNLLRD